MLKMSSLLESFLMGTRKWVAPNHIWKMCVCEAVGAVLTRNSRATNEQCSHTHTHQKTCHMGQCLKLHGHLQSSSSSHLKGLSSWGPGFWSPKRNRSPSRDSVNSQRSPRRDDYKNTHTHTHTQTEMMQSGIKLEIK